MLMKTVIPLVAVVLLTGCVSSSNVKDENAGLFFDCVDTAYVQINPDNTGNIKGAVDKAIAQCQDEAIEYARHVASDSGVRYNYVEKHAKGTFNPYLLKETAEKLTAYYQAHAAK